MSRLSIFVSSTMEDLANERDAVVQRIAGLNFEPLNAEGLPPTGETSWDRIDRALQRADLLVLILGGRYGWRPREGPGSGDDLSVTHLEFNRARELQIPILVFAKRLEYGADSESDDAKRRDAFRKEVGDWARGHFYAQFMLASDLAHKVERALLGLLQDTFIREQVVKRAALVRKQEPAAAPPSGGARVYVPKELVDLVRWHEILLFAGAGMSFSAGLPSARALARTLLYRMESEARAEGDEGDTGLVIPPSLWEASLGTVAGCFERQLGRGELMMEYRRYLRPPQTLQPSAAHVTAARWFKRIWTTNLDLLFESAYELLGVPFEVIADDRSVVDAPGQRLLVKLDGSLAEPSTLLFTHEDLSHRDERKPRLWSSFRNAVGKQAVLVVGSSVDDPMLQEVFRSRGASPCYIVSPVDDLFLKLRYDARIAFEGIQADADTFFEALSTELGGAAVA
jgi:hypothetical protein